MALIKIRRVYAFLTIAEAKSSIFSLAELMEASGWTKKTFDGYLSKKMRGMVTPVDGGFKAIGLTQHTEESFCRIFSQCPKLSTDPQKPLLANDVEGLVIKARESALAAVQHYNNPLSVSEAAPTSS